MRSLCSSSKRARLLVLILGTLCAAVAGGAESQSVTESARRIPVAADVDVVVVGGSTGAVSAACAAARGGARVFLAAPRPYLGEDVCATLRLWREADEKPTTDLAKRVFAEAGPVRPMHVKHVLDQALLEAGVPFLYGCYATDVLRDDAGHLAGVVVATRNGRQAICARVIIDATDRGVVARLASAEFRAFPAGRRTFQRVVIGGAVREAIGLTASRLPWRFGEHEVIEYTLSIAATGSLASLASAEQLARDMTFDPGQVDAADMLFHVPPDSLQAEASFIGAWSGADKIDLRVFRPRGLRMYVLGGCAAVSREAAGKLLRPVALMEVGQRIGRAAAEEVKGLPQPRQVIVGGGTDGGAAASGDVAELLIGPRPTARNLPMVASPRRAIPVLGEYDVVVVGGGTSGSPAAIAAARQGARVLLVEYQCSLGGVGTLGMIVTYWHGNRVGYLHEVEQGIAAIGAKIRAIGKAEYWRRECRQAGVEVWFGVLGCGAFLDKGTVKGVVVATPQGRGVVLGKVVIDATANADIAAAAGAACMMPGGDDLTMQMAGMPYHNLDDEKCNSSFTFADDTDLVDLWQLQVTAKQRFSSAYDLGKLVQTRGRRSVVGDFVMTPVDQYAGRTYPDSIVRCQSNYDKYNFAVHPIYLIRNPAKHETMYCYVPYRCLLPRGLEGILVIGLGKSADSDSMPIVRMQVDMQNEGYAAGTAAAMAVRSGRPPRHIDVRALQKHLVEKGNLPESVLSDADSLPQTVEMLAASVERAAKLDFKDMAIILASDRGKAMPLLRDAHQRASGEAKVHYARILGVLGDGAGASTLREVVKARPWDRGENVEPFGNQGSHYSERDLQIIAMGFSGDRSAVAVLAEKTRQLDSKSAYSHCRAVALAMESLHDPAGAAALAELLGKPGMTGHAIISIERAQERFGQGPQRTTEHLNERLRELVLARALYRCGDERGLAASILKQYEYDLCGHFARHAQAVLNSRQQPP